MKTTSLAIAAISLLQVVSAQPHRRRHAHGVEHQLVKKDDVVVTVVDTVYAQPTEEAEVIVYVDQDGNPVSTTTKYILAAYSTAFGSASTPKPSSSSSTSSTTPIAAPAPTIAAAPVVQNVPQPQVQPAASSSKAPEVVVQAPAAPATTPAVIAAAPAATVAQVVAPALAPSAPQVEAAKPTPTVLSAAGPAPYSASPANGFGFSYSPYRADGTCKTQSQVNQDFASINGYSMVRIYGTDCNQVTTVLNVCKSKGMKLFAGVFHIDNVAAEVATIIAAAKGDWTAFDTISVGNEIVNSNAGAVNQVIGAIGTARTLLRAAGYIGSVVTVDTLVAARNHPELCDHSDYCAVNCHPFFDGSYVAADAGKFLADMIPTLASKLANKNQKIVITETGWPWKGQTNGKAIPSLDNQAAALSSIKTKFASSPSSVVLFTAFNDMWKKNDASQFEAEQFWGMGGHNAPSE